MAGALVSKDAGMNWRKVAQLTLVHVGVSITVLPIQSTLNRIMIADMGFPALLVGLLISLPYLLSPIQVMMGAWSDKTPIWGLHRSPWMVLGGLMAAFGCYGAGHAIYWMETDFALGLLAAVAVFTVWGLGVNIASVSYLSLATELAGQHSGWRSRSVSIMWTAMILSYIVLGILLGRWLEPFSRETLFAVFGGVWLASVLMVLVGSVRVEPQASGRTVQHSADNPVTAIQVVMANPSAQRFFVYLVLVLVSIHAQDVLLEPFGAEVLGMSVAQTSRLSSIWGIGVFVTLLGGIPLVRYWGKKPSANAGALVAAAGFASIVLCGALGTVPGFMFAILLLGLGAGLMTVANLSFMMDMVIPEAAGLYMGAWGVANFAGQAIGNILSGGLRDLAFWLTRDPIVGYSVVFGLEVVGLFIAIWLFRTISVEQFHRDAEVRLADVLAVAGD
jgi:BCD family chlorophyll transporter-like MFS transporter